MSVSERWLLPDGVDELLPPEAWAIEQMRRTLLDVYKNFGYELVSPPLIEFIESLLTGTGNELNLQTFKVTDQLTGRLMGVRADITPQIARIDAHLLDSHSVNRLCYVNTVLHTRPAHAMTNRSPLQVGCELFGEPSHAADLEVISLMLETLHISGIQNIHIDVAHVGIYKGLLESANFDCSTEDKIFDALGRKSIPELDVLAANAKSNADIILLIRDIANLSGGISSLEEIKRLVESSLLSSPEMVLSAIEDLQSISKQIKQRFESVEIGFDFCELRGYNYHTGMMFSAFNVDYGHALAKGGRYDGVGKEFGQPRPATGFSADLKTLFRVAQKNKTSSVSMTREKSILAPAGNSKELLDKISELRQSCCVIQLLDELSQETYGCSQRLVFESQSWKIEEI